MKIASIPSGVLLLAALSLPCTLHAGLTVHEWGTFTVLQGSDGQALRWYEPLRDYHALPAFVHRPQANPVMKATAPDGAAIARMETPVLYFYPDAEMDISVTASLQGGRLTEWFPDALRTAPSLEQSPRSLQWIGHLFPANAPVAAHIPRNEDAAGRHYDAARAVPDAWIFRSSLPKPAPRPDPVDAKRFLPPVAEVDRVLFYRGAADLQPPVQVTTGDDATFSLSNVSGQPMAAAFALQSSPKGIAWVRMDGFQPVQWVDGKPVNIKSFTFPEAKDRTEGIATLSRAVTETLVTEGLTPAEAAAMVTTWQDLWFTETGTRVLSILPEPWVDQTVPLSINPVPDKLERVYVLRTEILTKFREETLADLLAGGGDPAAGRPQLAALELGRFTFGALPRAKQILNARQDARFSALLAAP